MRLLVTAGPTREPLDPVRFISNRSSGKMGYALAQAGLDRGWNVTLVSGPVSIEPPRGALFVSVGTAEEMLAAIKEHLKDCDVLIMCAAVADWRPARYSSAKLKKAGMSGSLELERTPDILAEIKACKGSRIFVGFAAETGDPALEARRKLREKGLDLIVANDVSAPDAGFEADTNRAVMIDRAGNAAELPLMTKQEMASLILDRILGVFKGAKAQHLD